LSSTAGATRRAPLVGTAAVTYTAVLDNTAVSVPTTGVSSADAAVLEAATSAAAAALNVTAPSTVATVGQATTSNSTDQRCIARKVGGFEVSCDGIGYTFSVPPQCQTEACGVIFDIHGAMMFGDLQNQHSNLRSLGNAAGYIVVHPRAPFPFTWVPSTHHRLLVDFLRQTVAAFSADRHRVHVSGFSQGGYASWSILCLASDLVCSIAPLASSGQDNWGQGYGGNFGLGSSCFGTSADGPEFMRSVMYQAGKRDLHASFSHFNPTVENVKQQYNITAAGVTVAAGRKFQHTRYNTGDGVALESIWHKYSGWLFTGYGHCFPTTRRKGTSGRGPSMCHRRNDYDWGASVLKFFQDNPCVNKSALSPNINASTPAPAPATECFCTSPDGQGGTDCWANRREGYTCSAGCSARLTGEWTIHWLRLYRKYGCYAWTAAPTPGPVTPTPAPTKPTPAPTNSTPVSGGSTGWGMYGFPHGHCRGSTSWTGQDVWKPSFPTSPVKLTNGECISYKQLDGKSLSLKGSCTEDKRRKAESGKRIEYTIYYGNTCSGRVYRTHKYRDNQCKVINSWWFKKDAVKFFCITAPPPPSPPATAMPLPTSIGWSMTGYPHDRCSGSPSWTGQDVWRPSFASNPLHLNNGDCVSFTQKDRQVLSLKGSCTDGQHVNYEVFSGAACSGTATSSFHHKNGECSKINGPWFRKDAVKFQCSNTAAPAPTPGPKYDTTKCSDWGNDCCASSQWGEPQTCKDGYRPVPSAGGQCLSKYLLCSSHQQGIGCYACFPPDGATPTPTPTSTSTPTPTPTPTDTVSPLCSCTSPDGNGGHDCWANPLHDEPYTCSGGCAGTPTRASIWVGVSRRLLGQSKKQYHQYKCESVEEPPVTSLPVT